MDCCPSPAALPGRRPRYCRRQPAPEPGAFGGEWAGEAVHGWWRNDEIYALKLPMDDDDG
ncbi:hypothetical protein RMCT_2672 [Mycolicibacterium thermoresistibile]|uniref:Uncharacterized protein n=1 Tax=Mycolicibacterium thermoresistibile TaxID=1797 RepID=A0A100XFS0_MYCTH|nr:hypothetical protein RMCT_2672 [Mycolicibacterium thermoresistibile]